MQYSDDYFLSVLPELNPPLEDVPRAVMTELESLAADDRIDFGLAINRQCSVLWTYAVFEQLRLGNFEYDISTSKIPDASGLLWRDINTVAFGLFDPEFEGEGFGLAILSNSPPHADPQDKHRGLIHFRRLNRSFPVIVRHMETELHGLHVPSLGSSACWVRSNHNPAHWGFLTSGHVVAGIGAGQGVPLASGTNGTMQNSKHPPIDAAFVSTSGPSRAELKKLAPLTTISFPAAGLPVDIVTSAGPQARHVVGVTNSFGVINTSYFGVQVFLDLPCSPGDSGSLVQTATGDAVALYSGALRGANYNNLTNQTLGLGQHFEQAAQQLGVSAFV